MSEKKKREKSAVRVSTLVGNTYLNNNSSLTLLFFVRLVFVCLISLGACLTVVQTYDIPADLLLVSEVTVAASVCLYTLFAMFRPAIGLCAVSCGLVIFLLINSVDKLKRYLIYFKDFILSRIDGRFLNTLPFIDTSELIRGSDAFNQGVVFCTLILCVLLSLIIVCSCRTRFHITTVCVTLILLLIPAFPGEIAGFYNGMLPFLVGVFGLYAVWSSYELEGYFLFGSYKTASNALYSEEKTYHHRTRSKLGYAKLREDLPRYCKYGGNAVTGAVLAVIALITAMAVVPAGASIDLKTLYENVADMISDVSDAFSDVLHLTTGVIDSKGYFNESPYDTSSSIDINAPSTGLAPVIDVILENPKDAVFLRGDIGVDYENGSWTTLNNIDSDKEKLLNSVVLNYAPEAEMQAFRECLTYSGYLPSKYVGFQKIIINYIKNTRVVFNPTVPYEFVYRDNPDLEWYGDTVIRAKQDKGYLVTYESLTLYPKLDSDDFGSALESANLVRDTGGVGFTGEYSQTKAAAYREAISEIYTSIPQSEQDNVNRLLEQCGGLDYGNGSVSEQYEAVTALRDYLKMNYTYSLNTDNSSGGNTMLGNFLFGTKRGHCALYATAMVLGARALGYPARYVTGFVAQGGTPNGDGGYTVTLREKNMHAWVEVYFDGAGWLPFDPTGGAADTGTAVTTDATTTTEAVTTAPAVTSYDTTSVPSSVTSADITTKPPAKTNISIVTGTSGEAEAEPFTLDPAIIRAFVACAVIIALILIIMLLYRRFNAYEKRRIALLEKHATSKNARRLYAVMMRLLSYMKLLPTTGELPQEFARRCDYQLAETMDNKLLLAVRLAEKNEFGKEKLTADEYALLYATVMALYGICLEKRGRFMSLFIRFALLRLMR